MGKAILVIIVVVLSIYSLFDVLAASRHRIRALPRAAWVVLVLVPVLGPLGWLLAGRPNARSAAPPRPRTVAPDDDVDFLRDIERRRRRHGRRDSDDDGGAPT